MNPVASPTTLLEALGIRLALPLLLRALPLDGVLRTITPAPSARPSSRPLEAVERATDVVCRLPLIRTACLKRALMRYRMLRRDGHAASFVIGVRPGGEDGFQAHAWVTLDGVPVMEKEAVDYRPSFVWPAPRVTQSGTS